MADEISRLGIEVDTTSVKKATGDLNNLTASGKKAEQQASGVAAVFSKAQGPTNGASTASRKYAKELDGVGKSAKNASLQTGQLTSAVKSLAAPLAAFLGTREIARSAEQWTTLNNRLALVTETTEGLIDAQANVFSIAQNSRQPLSETAELYQRIATNADSLGLSGAGVAEVVDKISKTLAISGTSGASASAALTQLGQAFASGTLRGEELNSVLEQAPALAKSLADGLGVTTGELRKLGEEGALTADAVIDALLSQTDAIDTQFGKIQATGGQAFTVLGNSITKIVGELNDASGAGNSFANTIIKFSEYLDSGALTDSIIETFAIWSDVIADSASDLNGVIKQFDQFAGEGTDSVQFVIDAFKQLPANIKAYVQLVVTEYVSMFDRISTYAGAFKDGIAAIFTDDTIANVQARLAVDIKKVNDLRLDSITAILEEREATISAAEAERKRREEDRKASEERRKREREEFLNGRGKGGSGVVGVGGGSSESDSGIEKIRTQLADEETLITSSFVKRQNALAEHLAANQSFQDEYNELSLANVAKYNADLQVLRDQEQEAKFGALQKQFDQLQVSALSESELEKARYKSQLDTLKEAKALGLESIKSYQQLEEDLLNQHQARLTAIEKKGLSDRQKFQVLSMKDQAKTMFGLLAQQTAAAAQHNKTAFEANKVAAIANSAISTYEGAAKALSWGWPLGPIFAAAITAAGIANIASIKSQSFGGGGGVAPSVAATGATSSVAVTNQSSVPALSAQQQPVQDRGPQVVVNIQGDAVGFTEEGLAEKINELYDRDYIQARSV